MVSRPDSTLSSGLGQPVDVSGRSYCELKLANYETKHVDVPKAEEWFSKATNKLSYLPQILRVCFGDPLNRTSS